MSGDADDEEESCATKDEAGAELSDMEPERHSERKSADSTCRMERYDLEHQDAEGSSSCAADREGAEEGIDSTVIELRQLFEEQLVNSQTSDRREPGWCRLGLLELIV